jgi:hypothetical protein
MRQSIALHQLCSTCTELDASGFVVRPKILFRSIAKPHSQCLRYFFALSFAQPFI